MLLAIIAFKLMIGALGFLIGTRVWMDNHEKQLTLRGDKSFLITVFSDLHFGEFANEPRGAEQDSRTLRLMNDVLDWEKPDFVVLNGDLITGEFTDRKNNTKYINRIVRPMMNHNLSWASTFGPHDHTVRSSAKKLYKAEIKLEGSRTGRRVAGSKVGITNYYVPVYSEDCREPSECVPRLLLWFFDSRGGSVYNEVDKYGYTVPQHNWVDASVAQWFFETNAKFRSIAGKPVPALAFVHLPTNATRMVQELGVKPATNPGINDQHPASTQSRGWCHNGLRPAQGVRCDYGGFDEPFMTVLATTPGLMGLFYGHDHGNTWCARWDTPIPGTFIKNRGLNMCYGQRTGYGGEGNWTRGSRMIKVSCGGLKEYAVDTWIRLEDGKRINRVTLNSTFGQDVYAPEDKKEN